MYRFFIKEEQIHDGMIEICGSDVNHIKNVLRMKTGDKVYLSNGSDLEYECSLLEWTDDTILAKIEDVHGMETELPVKITLYQGLPKGDKMEMIVQKAVELGVAEIVPVAMKRCVVKLDAKKAAKKVSRWNTIALSAAKQAKRGIIPEVREVRNFKDILEEVQDTEFMLVPYEEAKGMQASKELISQAKGKKSIGIIIGPEGGFEKEELAELYHITNPTPYTNENIFVGSQDSLTDIVTVQTELCRIAMEELMASSVPQTTYSTDVDNLLSAIGSELHALSLDFGNFIWLGIRDDYFVKLRVMTISFNPFLFDNNFSITFSNMIKSRSKRNDFISILGSGSNLGGSGARNNYVGNLQLTDDNIYQILQKILQSSSFTNKVQNIVNGSGGSIIGGSGGNYITPGTLEAEMIKCINIHAENGFFQYLQAELISAGQIVAQSGDFKKLAAYVANIDNLISGNVSAELGHIINLTAQNVIIDEAVIKNLIAAQITVSMLKAGTISADKFQIESDDGGMAIAGNTMQFKDKNGTVRIQIGRDSNNDFTFCLYDETGKGVLIDSTGIKESAIEDGLIKNDMIADSTIAKEKLAFQAVEQDNDGKIHVSDVVINGQGINASFTTIENKFSNMQTQIDGIKVSTPYTMNIYSSNGTMFRPGMINTTLSPTLYLGQSNITDMYDETHFIWTRQSPDSDGDHYWNTAHANGTKGLHITNEDVFGGASFTCSFFNEDKELARAVF